MFWGSAIAEETNRKLSKAKELCGSVWHGRRKRGSVTNVTQIPDFRHSVRVVSIERFLPNQARRKLGRGRLAKKSGWIALVILIARIHAV
jgi:hypothetical protein